MAFQYGSSGGPSGFGYDSGDWSSSVDTMVRPGMDVATTGWSSSAGGSLVSAINEAAASDAEYAYRAATGSESLSFELWRNGAPYSLPAGSHLVRMRADVTVGAAQARLLLLDSSDNVVGTGAWQALTPGFTSSAFSVTTSAAATRGRIEAAAA